LVSAGVGIAFAPASVQRVRFDGLLYKPLRGRPLESVTYLAWSQPAPSILLKAFVEIAIQGMGEAAFH
jgi:DNA-binding transcriptional LysR family regulator